MKVSFTHLVAWAIVEAAKEWPVMGRSFEVRDGKPHVIERSQVNLGIAVDVERKGGRSLMVPAIKGAESLDFAGFHASYEDLITKTRENKLTADDFQGTTISLTNPGGLGTVASVPRLMKGQGTIIATGSIAYPVEWAHAPGRQDQGARRLEGDDDDVDLRPPGDPGRRVRLVPAPDRPAAPGRGRASTSRSPSRCGSRRRRSRTPTPRRPPLRRSAPGRLPPAALRSSRPSRIASCCRRVQAATSLLKAYRTHGHLASRVNPLGDRSEGRPGARAREPQPDPGADGADPGLDPADRGRGRDAARLAAADARGLLRHDRLPDRAPLLAPAADVAARHDRDRLAPRRALGGGEAGAALAPERGLPVRALRPEGVPRPEDVLDRGPRRHRADDRRARHARPPRRRRGGRARDGPSRPRSASSSTTSAARSSRSSPSSRARRRSTGSRRSRRSPTPGPATSSTTTAPRGSSRPATARRSRSASTRTRRTSSSSTRSSPAAPAPRRPSTRARSSSTTRTPRSRCCCTATPPSRAREPSPRRSTCRRSPATRPAARSTSSPTTRWASRPTRRRTARPPTRATSRRASTARSSTSTPTTSRPASARCAWRWPTASAGAATSSST